ncbi:MAG: hypothetical protein RPU52_00420 [Candidatus Sedimenticola sp. (ex Thyasira tokunagai)]
MSDFAPQQWLEQLAREQLDSSLINEADDVLTKLALIGESHLASTQHIHDDARLSPEGKIADIGALKVQTHDRIERSVRPYIAQIKERIAIIEERIKPQDPDDPLLEHLKQREVRDRLTETDELKRMELYQSLAVSGEDDLCMRAIENAPNSFPLITDKALLMDGKRARALRGSPESSVKLKQLRQVRATVEAAIDKVMVVLELDSPIAQLEQVAANG